DDLLHGIVGAADLALLDLAVYDGPAGQDTLLYDSADGSDGARRPRFTAERKVEIAGRTWTCVMNSRALFDAQHDTDIVAAVMIGGILISLFLFYFTDRESRALGV